MFYICLFFRNGRAGFISVLDNWKGNIGKHNTTFIWVHIFFCCGGQGGWGRRVGSERTRTRTSFCILQPKATTKHQIKRKLNWKQLPFYGHRIYLCCVIKVYRDFIQASVVLNVNMQCCCGTRDAKWLVYAIASGHVRVYAPWIVE